MDLGKEHRTIEAPAPLDIPNTSPEPIPETAPIEEPAPSKEREPDLTPA